MNRLMIVDDDEGVSETLKIVLEEGYEVMVVGDGEACVKAVNSFLPDVILMDYQMGKLNGAQIMEKLLNLPWQPNVVLLSAHLDVDLARQFMKLGACDCIQKPCDLSTLRSVVKAAALRPAGQRHYARPFAFRVFENMTFLTSPDCMPDKDLTTRRMEFQKNLVCEALADCNGDLPRAADRLGLDREEFSNIVTGTFPAFSPAFPFGANRAGIY